VPVQALCCVEHTQRGMAPRKQMRNVRGGAQVVVVYILKQRGRQRQAHGGGLALALLALTALFVSAGLGGPARAASAGRAWPTRVSGGGPRTEATRHRHPKNTRIRAPLNFTKSSGNRRSSAGAIQKWSQIGIKIKIE
jgi:hypothetical protein